MVIGVLAIWMPAIFSNQKQSFLRFPYCMAALLISTVTNLAANLTLHHAHKTSAHASSFLIIGVCLGVIMCVIQGRDGDYSDRSLFIKIQKIESQQKRLKKQINTANKLARTVIAMTDQDEDETDIFNGSGKGSVTSIQVRGLLTLSTLY